MRQLYDVDHDLLIGEPDDPVALVDLQEVQQVGAKKLRWSLTASRWSLRNPIRWIRRLR